jgi:predicted PurR-regulated permease PerM
VPILAKEMPLLREQVPVLFDRLNTMLQPLLAQWGLQLSLDVENIKAFVLKYLNANFEDAFASLLASVKIGGSVALAIVGNAVLIPVALFYLLMDWDRRGAAAASLVPQRARGAFDSFTAEADNVLGQYLRGQLLVMLILAVYYSVGWRCSV